MKDDQTDLAWTPPPPAPDRVDVPPGGKFAGVYYDHGVRCWFAVVHHPIAPSGAIHTITADFGDSTVTLGLTT